MKWWQTQARAKLQPVRQEIRAVWGMWALAERGWGEGKATELKPRQWSCRFSANLDLLHPRTSGPKRCPLLASKLQRSLWFSEHQEGNTAGLGWPGAAASNHQPRAGAGQTQFAGSRVLLETAALTCVPFFPRGGLTDLTALIIRAVT